MSRTDVHRPADVQLADPHNRHLLYRYPLWPWQVGLTSYKNLFCGCRLCTGATGRRVNVRRQRAAWRAKRRELLTVKDIGDWDVPPVSNKSWW